MKRTTKKKSPHSAALAHLRKADPTLHTAAKRVSSLLKSRRAEKLSELKLFEALCESVVSQQLAVKAADAIWARVMVALGGEVTPASVLKTRLPRLRRAGLSGAKAKTLKELSRAVDRGLSLSTLRTLTREDAEVRLTKVWGIGPWTTEMFLLFALEHPDIFSVRDLGLIRSMESLYKIKKDSHPRVYEAIAAKWSPHRSFASKVLWKIRDTEQKKSA